MDIQLVLTELVYIFNLNSLVIEYVNIAVFMNVFYYF